MIKFKKEYQVQTSKSIDEILDNINVKIRNQKLTKIPSIFDVVNYREFKIKDNKVEIEKFSIIRGIGLLTFDLSADTEETIIKCSIDSYKFIWIVFLGILIFLDSIFTFLILNAGNGVTFEIIIFISGLWIIPVLGGYLSFIFNRSRLEWYSQEILEDLKIISYS